MYTRDQKEWEHETEERNERRLAHLAVDQRWKSYAVSQTKIRHHNFENILNLQGKEKEGMKEEWNEGMRRRWTGEQQEKGKDCRSTALQQAGKLHFPAKLDDVCGPQSMIKNSSHFSFPWHLKVKSLNLKFPYFGLGSQKRVLGGRHGCKYTAGSI